MVKIIQEKGIAVKMDVETEYEEHRFKTFFTKEPETISWIEQIIKPGDVFYDVGANVGVFSLYARVFHGKGIQVLSFEPAYHNFNALCKNIILNEFAGSIMPYCVGLSDKTGFERIKLASTISGSASHIISGAPSELFKNFSPRFEQGTFCAALDELVFSYNFPFPNHIKIDVDGIEEQVILGAGKILNDEKLKSVLIEVTDDGGGKERIKNMMYEAGFNSNHPINFQPNSMRERRQRTGNFGLLENIIFTR